MRCRVSVLFRIKLRMLGPIGMACSPLSKKRGNRFRTVSNTDSAVVVAVVVPQTEKTICHADKLMVTVPIPFKSLRRLKLTLFVTRRNQQNKN